ncbi:MAG: hypothetical protein HY319_30265 [Armatimonadetes bacterium]|nr:hypothetical protein [Armatimonadota bacterium]
MPWRLDPMVMLQRVFDACYALTYRSLQPGAVDTLLVAHRGVFGHPGVRENTLQAFDLAVDRGGALEMDLRLTSDRLPVIHHDPSLLRVHGVGARVRETSLARLKELAPAVPTLDEVLSRYRGRCPRFFLELKVYEPAEELEGLVRQVGRCLRELDLLDSAAILSLDPRPLDCARRLLPEVPRVYVYTVSPALAAAYVRDHRDTGVAGWYFRFPYALRPLLADRGLLEGVGFVNHHNTLTTFRNLGFRHQFTDRIDRLVCLNPAPELPRTSSDR